MDEILTDLKELIKKIKNEWVNISEYSKEMPILEENFEKLKERLREDTFKKN